MPVLALMLVPVLVDASLGGLPPVAFKICVQEGKGRASRGEKVVVRLVKL